MDILKREPALVVGALQALLVLLVSFGVDVTKEQSAAILALAAALLSVVTRQMVSPLGPSAK